MPVRALRDWPEIDAGGWLGGIAAAASSNGSRAEGMGAGSDDALEASSAGGVFACGAEGESAGEEGLAGDAARSVWIGSGNCVTADGLSDGAGLERTIATVGGGVADVMG